MGGSGLKPKGRSGPNPFATGAIIFVILLVLGGAIGGGIYLMNHRAGDSRLLGAWQSDAALTLAERKKAKPVSAQEAAETVREPKLSTIIRRWAPKSGD